MYSGTNTMKHRIEVNLKNKECLYYPAFTLLSIYWGNILLKKVKSPAMFMHQLFTLARHGNKLNVDR